MSPVKVLFPSEESILSPVRVSFPSEESTLPAVRVLFPSEESIMSAVRVLFPSEESTLSAVRVILPNGESILSAVRVLLPRGGSTLSAARVSFPSEGSTLSAVRVLFSKKDCVSFIYSESLNLYFFSFSLNKEPSARIRRVYRYAYEARSRHTHEPARRKFNKTIRLLIKNHKKRTPLTSVNGVRYKEVRVVGLEPTRLATPDPKSGLSTNFSIPAYRICGRKDTTKIWNFQIFSKNYSILVVSRGARVF